MHGIYTIKMAAEDNNFWRIIINWITPLAAAMSVVKLATKMIVKDLTWSGAILTGIISVLMGIAAGSITYIANIEFINQENMTALWRSLFMTSAMTFVGEKFSTWFVYGFEIDKALDSIAKAFVEWLKKQIK